MGATVKGFFFERALQELDARKMPRVSMRRYAMFKDYPLADYRTLLVEASAQLYPQLPTREALRRLGQLAYPTLANTMIGRVIFGILGDDLPKVMKAAAKGYKIALQPGSATVLEVGDHHSHVRLDEIYVFSDSYQVGVFEGAITSCNRQGEVAIKRHAPTSVELWCRWS
jgi:uncharacterized protein (TIGR02265 family)